MLHGVVYKYNGEQNWLPTVVGNKNLNIFASNGTKLFVGGEGLYQSEDGQNWQPMNIPAAASITALFASVAKIYAVAGEKIYFSQDLGQHWSESMNGIALAEGEHLKKFLQTEQGLLMISSKAAYVLHDEDENAAWVKLSNEGVSGTTYSADFSDGKIYRFTTHGLFVYPLGD